MPSLFMGLCMLILKEEIIGMCKLKLGFSGKTTMVRSTINKEEHVPTRIVSPANQSVNKSSFVMLYTKFYHDSIIMYSIKLIIINVTIT